LLQISARNESFGESGGIGLISGSVLAKKQKARFARKRASIGPDATETLFFYGEEPSPGTNRRAQVARAPARC
jgi:hypothetical protein